MLNQYQKLGLTVLVNLGIAIGGALPGMTLPVPALVAQAPDQADQAFDEGLALFNKKDTASLRQAIGAFQKSLRLSEQSKNQMRQAYTLVLLGRVHADLAEKQKALTFYDQALPLFRSIGDRKGEGLTLDQLGSIYADLGDTQKALEYYNQALPIRQATNDRTGEAITLRRLGLLYADLGEAKKALALHQQALQIVKSLGDRSNEASILNSIGYTYDRLGEKQKSLELFNQALLIHRALGNRFGEATVLNNIGSTYSDVGEKQKALEYYNQSLSIRKTINDRSGEALTLNSMGVTYYELGENAKALELYSQALIIRREVNDRMGEATTSSNIGLIYAKSDNNQKALEFYQTSLSILQSIKNRNAENKSIEATTLNNIGRLYSDLGQNQKALDIYNQALPIVRSIGNKTMEATLLHNIGPVYSNLGNPSKALEFYSQALPIWQAVSNRSGQVVTFSNIATSHVAQSNLKLALQNINTAIDLIESLRSELNNDALKTSYFKSVQSYYQIKIEILMQLHQQQPTQGYDATALETVDQSRARVLLELLFQSKINLTAKLSPELLAKEKALNQALDSKELQLIQLSNQPNATSKIQALNQEIAKLYADRDDLKNTIRAASPDYANLQYPKTAKLAQLQQQLDPDTLMLQYSLGDRQSYLWVVSKTDLKTYVLPKRGDIEKNANEFLQDILAKDIPTQSAQILTQQILTPAASLLSQKRLVIIPDGILHKVPFAALTLPNSKTYSPLLTQHEITNLPSASTIGILRSTVAQKTRGPKTIAILADPIFNQNDDRLVKSPNLSGLENRDQIDTIITNRIKRSGRTGRNLDYSRLPGTADEANGILSLVPNVNDRTAAFGFDANYDWITSPKLSQYRYIHLATHGFFDGEKPAFSSIVLSSFDQQGRNRKAYLRLPELFNLNLPSELIVLSACETGLGDDVPGEGLVGMTRGLMYAGALRVSTTLWQVDDSATARLMQQFYKSLWQSQKSHAASLRESQLKLWNEGSSPYFWAAFTLQGEWKN